MTPVVQPSSFELNQEYTLSELIHNPSLQKGAFVKLTRPDGLSKYAVFSYIQHIVNKIYDVRGLQLPEYFPVLMKHRNDFYAMWLIPNLNLEPTKEREDSSKYKIEVLAHDYFKYLSTVEKALSPILPLPLISLTQQYLAIR